MAFFLSLFLVACVVADASMFGSMTHNGIGSTPSQRHYISACQAQSIILAAAANASSIDVADNIAIMDPSGLLVGFLRMDNAFPGGIDLAIKKAKTVVLFNGLTSAVLYPASLPGSGTLYGETFPLTRSSSQQSLKNDAACFDLRNDNALTACLTSGLEETNDGLVVFPGGQPLFKDGYLIGAIGVSGGTVDQDTSVAQVGADHLANIEDEC